MFRMIFCIAGFLEEPTEFFPDATTIQHSSQLVFVHHALEMLDLFMQFLDHYRIFFIATEDDRFLMEYALQMTLIIVRLLITEDESLDVSERGLEIDRLDWLFLLHSR